MQVSMIYFIPVGSLATLAIVLSMWAYVNVRRAARRVAGKGKRSATEQAPRGDRTLLSEEQQRKDW